MKISLKSNSDTDSNYAVVYAYRAGAEHIATVEVVTETNGEQSLKLTLYVSGLNHCVQAGIIQHASNFIDAEFSGEELVYEAEV